MGDGHGWSVTARFVTASPPDFSGSGVEGDDGTVFPAHGQQHQPGLDSG
jgi:hypothetical protein